MFKFVKKDLGNLGMPKPVFPKIYFEFYYNKIKWCILIINQFIFRSVLLKFSKWKRDKGSEESRKTKKIQIN